MDSTFPQFAGAALAFIVIFLSGYALKHAGKPYGVALLSAHKLVALGLLVFLGLAALHAQGQGLLSPAAWTASLAGGLVFLAAIASGGAVSVPRAMPPAVVLAHRLLPYLALVACGAAAALAYAGG